MNETDENQSRDRIIAAIKAYIVFDGWSQKSLRLAAQDAGFDTGAALRAFPAGVTAAIKYYFDWGDRHMQAVLAEQDLVTMTVRDRIITAIQVRLDIFGDREIVRRTLSVLALPMNIWSSLQITYRTTHAMWYAVGDTSTDVTFYTKRALLGSIYTAALLYWLDDTSENCQNTREFLGRCMVSITQLNTLRSSLERNLQFIPNPIRFFRLLANRS